MKEVSRSEATGLSIGVFCSANDLDQIYVEPARTFARLMAQGGYDLVWGGSNIGLMEVIASEAQSFGSRITGVTVDFLERYAREDADEMIITSSLGARKDLIVERSSALAVMVGGTGTLDEVTDILEHKKHGHVEPPIVFLNTNSFYEGFRMQLERMRETGMLTVPLDQLAHFADTPEEAFNYLEGVLQVNNGTTS